MMIKLSKASIGYSREECLLKEVDYEFGATGFYFVLGKSGIGKSTLLAVIGGLLKPLSGKVEVFHKKPITYVFQEPNLLNGLPAKENGGFSLITSGVEPQLVERKVKEQFQKLGILELMAKKPEEMSGGEKQRIALIRALLGENEILLADEPTGALDFLNAKIVMDALKQASKDRLILCVTHNIELAREYGDFILEIKDQKLVEVQRKEEGRKPEKKDKKELAKPEKMKVKEALNIAFSLFHKKKGRLWLSSIVCGFAFALLTFAFSILMNSDRFQKSMTDGYYSKDVFKIAQQETITQSNGLNLVRNNELANVTKREISEKFSSSFYPSLSYFLPSSFEYPWENKIIDISVEPTFKKMGIQSSEEVFCNTSLLEALKSSKSKMKGKVFTLPVSRSVEIYYGDQTKVESFNHSWRFKIVDVIEEKGFFNSPTIYYDYSKVFDELGNLVIEGESGYKVKDFFIRNEYAGTAVRNYETVLRTSDYDAFIAWANKRKKTFTLTSKYKAASEAAVSIAESISKIAIVLTFSVVVIVFFIEFFTIFTMNMELEKEFALVKIFSSNPRSYHSILHFNRLFYFLFSLIPLVLMIPLLLKGIGLFMERIGLPKELLSLSFTAFLLSICFMFLIQFVASSIPFYKLKKDNLSHVLRSNK